MRTGLAGAPDSLRSKPLDNSFALTANCYCHCHYSCLLSYLINFERVVRSTITVLPEPYLSHLSCDRTLEAVGNALVGGPAKQKKSHQGVWHIGRYLLRCVLDTLPDMKRSTLLIIFAAIVVVGGVSLFLWNGKKDRSRVVGSPPPMVSQTRNELPNLRVSFGDQSSVLLRDLSGDVVLVFFNPECEHCHEEAEMIAAEQTIFDGWEVYFIASVDAKAAEEFGVKYKLTSPNFHFASATVGDVYNAVGALNQVPTILIYKDNLFAGKYEGITPIDELKKNL
jgi:thiol-disulfide isomerase/thioredoxin